MKRLALVSIIALAFVCIGTTAFAYENPGQPTGFVNDFAGVLSPAEKGALEAKLLAYAKSSGNEVAVATVASLKGDTIENFAEKLFKDWGIGKAKQDNGLLLLVAPAEKEVRIEVGYGLEPYVTDAISGKIIREDVIPAFKEGKYGQGISDAVDGIIAALGESPSSPSSGGPGSSAGDALGNSIFAIIAAAVIFLRIFARSKAWWLGALFGALIGFVLFPSILAIALGAVAGLALGLFARQMPKGPRGPGGGLWFLGGMGGRGGFGGGGFGGFGGGRSGGGGASGSW